MRLGSTSATRAAVLVAVCIASAARAADRMNGFEITPSLVPPEEIVAGGPDRDGIPALDHPEAVPAAQARWADDTVVIGVEVGASARAYPIQILVWHELANDTLGGRPIAVTWAPLSGTGMVFAREVGERPRVFGVSGLLFRSNQLIYDAETQSLWSQILGRAVTGPARGKRLALLRSTLRSWGEWRRMHPHTSVLSPNTGHVRDYAATPYGDYATSTQLRFPVPYDRAYHPKMPTLGLRSVDGAARAYPAAELVAAGGTIAERFADHAVRVTYDPARQVFDVDAPASVDVIEAFWFAWRAFHPESSVFTAPAPPGTRGAHIER